MTNRTDQYKVFRYYEGLCSSGDFTREIAKVLCLGNQNDDHSIMAQNWKIVYPPAPTTIDPRDTRGIVNAQVASINDYVILETTTSEKDLGENKEDDLTVDTTQNDKSLKMYLEIYKPTYLADPEKYPLDCERYDIIPELITRDLYTKQFSSYEAVEDDMMMNITPQTEKDDSYSDVVHEVDESFATDIVNKINAVHQFNFKLPQDGEPSVQEIGKEYVGVIKTNSDHKDLYVFLRETMQIQPAQYTLLNSIEIKITESSASQTNDKKYDISVRGIVIRTYYNFEEQTAALKTSVADIYEISPKLEWKLNGVYTPVPEKYYSYQNGVFTFLNANAKAQETDSRINSDWLKFEGNEKGIVVCRYNKRVKNPDDTTSKMDLIKNITERKTINNNHYVLMRLFDKLNLEENGPMENTVDANGEIVAMNAHVSDWAKLSWYRDFEEVMLDHLDEDVSTSTITDGSVLVPIETPGLNADTKIRYWINCNNDRFSLIVMGNPSLDYNTDRHLVSACYCGAIDSFDNSINDTAGNFALFTSSSTEPCATKLNIQSKVVLSADEDERDPSKKTPALDSAYPPYTNDDEANPGGAYAEEPVYVPAPVEGQYFDRSVWPTYSVNGPVDPASKTGKEHLWEKEVEYTDEETNTVKTKTVPLERIRVNNREYDMKDGKAVGMTIWIPADKNHANTSLGVFAKVLEDDKIITSGVSRDVFGNTVNVVKTNTYGKNTSDGVTSIMMYHTRSKAYYQKHHMLFATTEEYMSKVMYGKSMYTGEYYADRIKVTHGNDGPRGILSDLLVIDSASLYALDELVINKDFEKDAYENEETFIYFPITAPFSPLSDSPNATYGLAIKKSEKEPRLSSEIDLINKAFAQIQTYYATWKDSASNFSLLGFADAEDMEGKHPLIYWSIVPDTAWKRDANGNTVDDQYVPVKIVAVDNDNNYIGEAGSPLTDSYSTGGVANIAITAGSTKTDKSKINSYVKIAGFVPNDLTNDEGQIVTGEKENIYYGISDEKVKNINNGRNLIVSVNDGSQDANYPAETFKYGIKGVPYTGQIDAEKIPASKSTTPEAEINIIDASPSKYLVLYSGKELTNGSVLISKFANIPLGPGNALLQYPSDVSIISDNGKFYLRGEGTSASKTNATYVTTYNETVSVVCVPNAGYEFDSITTYHDNGEKIKDYALTDAAAYADSTETNKGYEQSETAEKDAGYPIFELDAVTETTRVVVKFKPSTNA